MRSRYKIFRLRTETTAPPAIPDALEAAEIWRLLCEGEILGPALVPWGSNYTYFVTLRAGELEHPAVYKPRRGEAPLYDFPSGTLYLREYASYLTSRWLGWDLVPRTAIREGPYGPGTIQQYVEADGPPHIYGVSPAAADQLRRLVVFDLLVNNADRKPAHAFTGPGNKLWAIDHGLTFHPRSKLRTVIWDFCGERISAEIMGELEAARGDEARRSRLQSELAPLLTPREIEAFWRRYDALLTRGAFPDLDSRYNVPYGFA